MERLIGASFLVGALFFTLLAGAPNLWLAAACVSLAHLGGATCWVFSTVRLQQTVPDEVRGRVFAAEDAAFMVVNALSNAAFAGMLDSSAPLYIVIGALGVMLLFPAAGWGIRGLLFRTRGHGATRAQGTDAGGPSS